MQTCHDIESTMESVPVQPLLENQDQGDVTPEKTSCWCLSALEIFDSQAEEITDENGWIKIGESFGTYRISNPLPSK